MKVITAREMARIDSSSGVNAETLMERAGRGLASFIYNYIPQRYKVVFVCGKGNNGGDGFAAARHLELMGRRAEVYTLTEVSAIEGLPLKQLNRLNIPVRALEKDEAPYIFAENAVVIDCILGTGFKPPLDKDIQSILEIINKNSKITLSCDIPTGVSGDTGKADESAVEADITVTFEYPKVGHVKGAGGELAGSLEVVDIGTGLSPGKYIEDFEIVTRQDISWYFRRREKKSHKKNYGHILIIGGSRALVSAPVMAAAGALHSGAGLVTCAMPPGNSSGLTGMPMSAMRLSVDENNDGTIKASAAKEILSFIEKRKIDAIVIGPGLGTGSNAGELVKSILTRCGVPAVVDADGLNVLVGQTEIIKDRKAPTVLTPHPGEMSRVTGKKTAVIQKNRLKETKALAGELGCTVLLKGHRTVVSDGEKVEINVTGNPSMAVGGTGDILSGIVGTLLGQGMEVLESAKAAAWVHGRSGDIAAWKYGPRFVGPEEFLEEIYRV
ncbi:MAG: NAD(P)H-hydrate dehydratase [Elusimicrobiota bacterium]|nr:NAD(P)H-hydrate dehydratase [Elusimicrobiota bacterium]